MNITKKLNRINEFLDTSLALRWLVWLIYIVLLCWVSYHHEPWHDEAQAWLIARDDSIWHMLTVTLHWEGHPPLWFLLLMPLAKLGVPFPLGLKLVNLCCCAVGMYFLVVKSPLPWMLRFFVPFSYFCFYQFGVVNRTYSLLMAAMFVTAYFYERRAEKPYQLAAALAVMSGAQAYGMMIATGVALVWGYELYKNKPQGALVGRPFFSKPCKALMCYFAVTFAWGLCIISRTDTEFILNRYKPLHG